MPDNRSSIKIAEVDRTEFLNWRCRNTILCKRSEYIADGNGFYRIEIEPEARFIRTPQNLADELRGLGWENFTAASNVYKNVFFRRHHSSAAAIGIRRHGIDFQVVYGGSEIDIETYPTRFPEGTLNLARHYYNDSGIDLFEFSINFAIESNLDINCISHYLIPRGKKKRMAPFSNDDWRTIREMLGDAMTDTEREAFGG